MLKKIKKYLLLNSLLSFLFISGIVFILDSKLALLEIFNATILRNIEKNSSLPTIYNYDNNSQSIVVLITNEMFEKEFNSQRPLNKDSLKKLLEIIAFKEPKKIIFDLEISPDYNFKKNSIKQDSELYDYLIDIASETQVILPATFIANTNENVKIKKEWARQLCQKNISFAFPFISSEIGSVLQYYDYANHISLFEKNESNKETICSKLEEYSLSNIIKIEIEELKNSKSHPINYETISTSSILINSFEDLKDISFKNKTVFIGGAYGLDDKYITPYGERFGVEVLNAIHYSKDNKIDIASFHLSTFVDILIGVFFGLILSFLLRLRERINTNNGFIANNLSLIFMGVLFIIISLETADFFFDRFYIWLNPVPIVVGMFIDMIIGMNNKDFNSSFAKSWFRYLVRFSFILIGIYSMI